MTHLSKLLLTSVFSISTAVSASAQIVVQGSGAARDCYMSTKTGDPGRIGTIHKCEAALKTLDLSRKDEAATHVNIGVLYMRKGDYEAAQSHYLSAMELRPNTPEIYINHAASLIYTGEYQDAINAVNKAIELGTDKMPEALYNRAMAYDRLENYKEAYKDLKQALILKPDWPAAIKALDNYTVTSSAHTN